MDTENCEAVTGLWHKIYWRAILKQVRRLQKRIAKATIAKKWRLVRKLQRLLISCKAAKLLAVKRVTQNKGKNTAGIDGQRWTCPTVKYLAAMSLKMKGYRAKPLKRVYVPKSNGKLRPISIPVMVDRAMQALLWFALDPVAESTADLNSYGFRQDRAPRDATGQCFTVLSRKHSAKWLLKADITGCFDNLSHAWLLKHIPINKKILNQWLTAGHIEKNRWWESTKGTAQGGIISPTLANMALDGLESRLRQQFPKQKVNLIRYADDFIITGQSPEQLQNVKATVEEFLNLRGLELSDDKTKIVSIQEGVDFLGQNLRKYNGKMLVKPSKQSLQAVSRKIKRVCQTMKTAKTENLIKQLNPIVQGWCNYHRHAASKRTFSQLKDRLFKITWQWAKRRHSNKGRRWIKNNYFGSQGNNHWTFKAGETDLINPASIKIVRHVKIRAAYNPYLSIWEAYKKARANRFREKLEH